MPAVFYCVMCSIEEAQQPTVEACAAPLSSIGAGITGLKRRCGADCAGTVVKLIMDQLLWAPIFLSGIVTAQFTLMVHAPS